MRTVTKTVELDAPPEEIWRVLSDTAAHSHWNPFITELHGTLEVGNRIDVRIAPPGGRPMSFHPTVTDLEPGRKLGWLGRSVIPGLFDGAHSFTLEPLPDGRTRLVQSETFRGVLVRFSGSLVQKTGAGFAAMNEALRRQISERNPV
ncbi:MAG: hypothetical protein JWO98_2955 [Frankiales bacterium]|nr:hypothetical protein [Frankiales bacterium]